MSDLDALRTLEAILADALRAADPRAELARRAEGLDDELRARVDAIDDDGLRVAALLVAKLRFQRLLNGSREAGAWWQRDEQGFTAAFRAYHRAVAPTAATPRGEAELFAQWQRDEA